MENFLSKIFNSKNKKRVYNVDKSKKQNLKKANKNLSQLSSANFTNKLRKEFGIYKPKSEFSTTNYNMPCVVQNREYSIESVDIIPQTFHEEQNVDLLKCTRDQGQKTRALLFVNDSHSDMEPESINKEFGIDETEGCDRQMVVLDTCHLDDTARRKNLQQIELQILQKTEKDKFSEGKEQEETSYDSSSPTTMEIRKDSLNGRYKDACVQLNNSYKCNKEFIFESKKEHDVEANNIELIADNSKRHDNVQERDTFVYNDTPPGCSSFSGRYDASLGCHNEKANIEAIHDLNKFLITKKGRIKCKSSEKEKLKKSNKVKEDDGLSRHRYYHSMIILGGKKKTKPTHSKNVKITNTEILEVTQKKFGGEFSNTESKVSLDFVPCDETSLLVQNPSSSVRTMCFRNSNNKLCAVNISPSEHTLKWLDENFGPGFKNTTLNDPDETNFSDPLDDLNIKVDQNRCEGCTNTTIESHAQEAVLIHDLNKEEINSKDCSYSGAVDESIAIEGKIDMNSIKPGDDNSEKIKTVQVLSFKKSRISKSNMNSCEINIEDKHDILTNIKDKSERNVDVQIIENNSNESTKISEELDGSKQEHTKSHEGNEVSTKLPNDNNTVIDTKPERNTHQKLISYNGDVNKSNGLNKDKSATQNDSGLERITCPKDVASKNKNKDCTENIRRTHDIVNEPFIREHTTNLKLQNENIFGILRAQEKRSLASISDKTSEKKGYNNDLPHKIDLNLETREDEIVLKLNDKVVNVDDQIDGNKIVETKTNKRLTKKCSQEDSKRRHEELEKDYLITRLELALDTEVIEKPEMAEYILKKSQEVMKDVVEKTNENITKKLLNQGSQGIGVETQKVSENVIVDHSGVEKLNSKSPLYIRDSDTKKDIKETMLNGKMKENCCENEKVVKYPEKQDQTEKNITTQDHHSCKVLTKDLNNISKIENVKIYRKESKETQVEGKNTSHSIDSIDNILKNKTLLLEEIKSLKRK